MVSGRERSCAMKKDELIRSALQYIIFDKGIKDFVIFPFGTYGKLTKKILNDEFSIIERYVVDNNQNLSNVRDIAYLKDDYKSNKDFIILLAVDPIGWEKSAEIHAILDSFASLDRVVDILSLSPYFAPWVNYSSMNTEKDSVQAIECIAREIYKNGITGAVAEAGVYKGNTAKYINCLFPDRKLHLFDTFRGFPEKDKKREDERGFYRSDIDFSDTAEELVMKKMTFPDKVIIHKGWFPETTQGIVDNFSFVRLDMDLYDPIYAGLVYFYPRMEKGGYIFIHDCRSKNFEGARAAVQDFCKKEHVGYLCMPDLLGSAVINIGW